MDVSQEDHASGSTRSFLPTTTRFRPDSRRARRFVAFRSAGLRFPDPLATCVRPAAASDLDRSKHEGMFLAIISDSFTGNETGVSNRFCDDEHTEVALREIAERVEIEHLTIDVKEGMLCVVGGGGFTHDHTESVRTLGTNIRGHTARAAESPEIDDGINDIGPGAGGEKKTNEEGDERKRGAKVHKVNPANPDLPLPASDPVSVTSGLAAGRRQRQC